MRAIDYFDKQAEAVPDRIAIIDGGARYSYADVRSASMRIARAMWAAGLRGEEPVAIYSINDARVLLCMLGLMRAGAVWVPINYRNAPDANVEYLNYVKTSWLFYHSSYSDRVPRTPSTRPHTDSSDLH
ncbi:MAG: AMP-binding protein [Candidatus Acidiferrales bacterium]